MPDSVSIERAAQIATEELGYQQLSPSYRIHSKTSPVVSRSCVADLVTANRLTSPSPGLVSEKDVRNIFSRTRILDGTGLSVLRVSITPPSPGGPCDPIAPAGIEPRSQSGWDFANTAGLSSDDRWAGIAGVWPLSEETMRRAMRLEAYFLPAMKGFVDGSLIRRVTGYYLDLTSKRRWVQTRKIREEERSLILPSRPYGEPWEHAWLNIPQGPIAAAALDESDSRIADFKIQV